MKRSARLALPVILLVAAIVAVGCGSGKPAESSAPKVPAKGPIQKVTVGDIEVAYRTYGKGAPLVAIMGFSGTMDTWDPNFIAALAKKYRVVMFDNRGMGETTAGSKEFTISTFASDTAGFMDAMKIEKADVLGFSMGSTIAQELVLQTPEKVNGLILYGASCGGPQAVPPTQQVLAQLMDSSGTPQQRGQRMLMLMFPPPWLDQPKNMDYIMATLGKSSEPVAPESVDKQLGAIASWGGSYDRLPSIKNPTVLLTGTEDVIVPPQNSVVMAGRIPAAWLIQVRGGGHGLMFQYPEAAATYVLDFLSSP